MNYGQFLLQWYNLALLAAAGAGVVCVAAGRLSGRDMAAPAAGLLGAAVFGLTWNGALHDLALGSPAQQFPVVALVSAAFGFIFGRWVGRIRRRYFRPIQSVAFNQPGHEGVGAKIVTRTAGPAPGSGRAQWQDAAGVLHVVHVHTDGPTLRFGAHVELGPFDIRSESYLVEPTLGARSRSRTRGHGRGEQPLEGGS